MTGEAYDLQVLGENGLGPRKANVAAPAEGVELIASAKGGIRGVARDADTGRPLRDFEVTYRASRQGGGMQMRFGFGGRGGRGPDQPTTFHADDGAFLLEEVPAGKWDVEVKADGYQAGSAGGVAVDESAVAENVEVRLSKGGVISGRVLDSRSGGPIRDAALRAEVSGGGGPVMRMGPGAEDQRHASSDADGKFEITGLAPGTYKVTATHSDWSEASESVELKAAAAAVDIKMSVGASVVGVVLGAGQRPVSGAGVSLGAAGGGGMGPFGGEEQSTVADPSGRFRFERLTPGRYTVTATLRSESSTPAEVVVQSGEGERTVTLNLRTGATVRGMVTGLAENQRVGVNVTASGPEDFFSSLRTDAAGAFEFTGVPAGAINLRASAGDFMTSTRSAATQVVVPEGQLEVSAEIVFEEGFRLDGHVSRGGKPVTDAMVNASPEGGGGGRQRSATGRTDESGAFALEGLAAGTYMVNAFPQSGGSMIRKSVTLSGDTSVELEAPPARLAGTVVEQGTGRPIGDAEIRAEDPQPTPGRGGMMMVQTSDSGGRFVFDGVEPQPYRVSVQKAAYQSETRQVTAGEDTDVVIELKRGEGIGVTAKDGIYQTPLRSLFVRIADGSGAAAFSGSVGLDSDGHGEIPSVRPGSYQLRASAQGYAPVGPVTINVPSSSVNLSLTPGGTLELQVGPQTMALANPTAHITLASGAPYIGTFFGPGDGSLRLSPGVRRMENMSPGSYLIAVDGGGARKAFDIAEGGTATVVLP
jgi:hypothetical protein